MTDVPQLEDESSSTARRLHEAFIKFEPTEQLDELLSAFLNDIALRKRGTKAMELSLEMRPYRFTASDRTANGLMVESSRMLHDIIPSSMLVGKNWMFKTDGNRERAATRLKIAMRIGGTAAEQTVSSLPILRGTALPLIATVEYNRKDLLSARELETARQDVAHALEAHTAATDIYASGFYQVLHPKLVTRPVRDFTVLHGKSK